MRKVHFSDKVEIYYYPKTNNINYFLIDKQRFKDRCLRFEKLYIKSLVVKKKKMATAIVTMIVSAGINALAFSGSNFLFSSLSGGEEERKRHDLAVEQLSSARDKWNEKRLKNLDYINTKLRSEQHATNTFSDVDYAMKEYAKYNSIIIFRII